MTFNAATETGQDPPFPDWRVLAYRAFQGCRRDTVLDVEFLLLLPRYDLLLHVKLAGFEPATS